MHEDWLQKYIKEHFRQLGFDEIHGPYKRGSDFKGSYSGKAVKIEAEWGYSDYVSHGHSLVFADVLVVASLSPLPPNLKVRLPSIIINLDRQMVLEWAQPRLVRKISEDYTAYPWRRLSRSLIDLYACYRKQNHLKLDFLGSDLALSCYPAHTPAGFQFSSGGNQKSFEGPPEDRVSWDFWLTIAHAVAADFHLKPALLRPTWIDRVALYLNHTGRVTVGELQRFQEVAEFIDQLFTSDTPGL